MINFAITMYLILAILFFCFQVGFILETASKEVTKPVAVLIAFFASLVWPLWSSMHYGMIFAKQNKAEKKFKKRNREQKELVEAMMGKDD